MMKQQALKGEKYSTIASGVGVTFGGNEEEYVGIWSAREAFVGGIAV